MSILVFGKTGQVAREIAAASGDVTCLGREGADLSAPGACDAAIRATRPRAVVNAAAWTDVDGAEAAEAEATRINGDAPGEMAGTCAALGVPLVHISTDYVFDGTGERPWAPGDPTGPLGAYGRSKLKGERGVTEAGGAHVVLRTAWVFSAHGKNFVKTMAALGETRDSLTVVGDQIGGPTPAAAIAVACLRIADALADGAPSGVHHFCGAPDASWADLARAVMAQAGHACAVTDIASADWPTPAPRPLNSRLDCGSLQTTFGIARPDWRAGVADVVAQLRANASS